MDKADKLFLIVEDKSQRTGHGNLFVCQAYEGLLRTAINNPGYFIQYVDELIRISEGGTSNEKSN